MAEGVLHLGFKEVAVSSLGMLALGEASCHVMGLAGLRLPCCEEAQANYVKRLWGERGPVSSCSLAIPAR